MDGDVDNPKPVCIVCGIKISNESMLPSKLGKHLKSKHSHLQDKPTSYFKRMSEQQGKAADFLRSLMTVSDKAQIAFYQVSELIAQNMKSHTLDESFILPACQKIVSAKLGNEAAMQISEITLSNDTVNRRNLEMSSDIEKNVCGNNPQCSDFALQFDESTDIINKAQLIAFIRFVNENEITNQFFVCKELSLTTKAEGVFNILNNDLDKWQSSWKSCVGIGTDGATSMICCSKGLVSSIKEQSENVIVTHCFLHREALMARSLG